MMYFNLFVFELASGLDVRNALSNNLNYYDKLKFYIYSISASASNAN